MSLGFFAGYAFISLVFFSSIKGERIWVFFVAYFVFRIFDGVFDFWGFDVFTSSNFSVDITLIAVPVLADTADCVAAAEPSFFSAASGSSSIKSPASSMSSSASSKSASSSAVGVVVVPPDAPPPGEVPDGAEPQAPPLHA